MKTFKCSFPENVCKDFRAQTVISVWRLLFLSAICIVCCIALACQPVSDTVRYGLAGIAVLATLCGSLQLWARRILGFGYPPHYPNASKTAEVFCTLDETGLKFSSPDSSVIYLPEVSWDEIKSYRIVESTLFLTSDLWGMVLVALDMNGHPLEEWRELAALMKSRNVSEI